MKIGSSIDSEAEMEGLRQPFRTMIYRDAEEVLRSAIVLDDLDRQVASGKIDLGRLDRAIDRALELAYGLQSDDGADSEEARLFLQRTLYRIYRMKLFWYDDLRNYVNERSMVLLELHDRIERPWQAWEGRALGSEVFRVGDVANGLALRVARDLDPEPDEESLYFRDHVTEWGYRELLAISSLDGLVEASQLSRTLGGPGNPIHAVLTRLLTEEYGFGRLARKHSSYFAAMLEELGMRTEPEAYFDAVPWEVLAAINQSFLLSERKRYFLRYIGGLLYTEVSVPAAFAQYRAAAERLGFSERGMAYWDLHIKVDKAHGRWMYDDVALPLIERYPSDAWELLLGYDQARFMSMRAGSAVRRAVIRAEQEAGHETRTHSHHESTLHFSSSDSTDGLGRA